MRLVAEGATWTSDGGGKITSARNVIRGADRIVRFLLGLSRRYAAHIVFRGVSVNGEPGLALFRAGRLLGVWAIRTDGLRVLDMFVVMNPDKLGNVSLGAAC